MKVCIACKKPKSVDEFYRDRRLRSGHTSRCKACITEREQELKRERANG